MYEKTRQVFPWQVSLLKSWQARIQEWGEGVHAPPVLHMRANMHTLDIDSIL